MAVVEALMKAPTDASALTESFPNGRVMHPAKYGPGTIAENSLMVHQSGGNIIVVFDSGHIARFPESKWHTLHPLSEINMTDSKQARDQSMRESLARHQQWLSEIKLPPLRDEESDDDPPVPKTETYSAEDVAARRAAELWNEEQQAQSEALLDMARAGGATSKAATLAQRLLALKHLR